MADITEAAAKHTQPSHTENHKARQEQIRILLRLGDLEDAEANLVDALARARAEITMLREKMKLFQK
ncbi:hypothetical protein LCGC14_0374980 [marine sediment metagenome]|uniref:Uncharacterized protein n=1 Tax=marine sediment metagenome TaxID=412755 RepID=A0A0F9VR51_9ZZZZ